MKESIKNRTDRMIQIINILKQCYPDAKTALIQNNPLQLLVATILSAQCTDVRVNTVTPALFKKYPDTHAFATAVQEELENDIRSTGFFRNKAKNIRECCKSLQEKHNGEVPVSMEELVKLPGIGRKTANCIRGNAFGLPAITVDTHVKRLSMRMKLTKEIHPDKIEFELRNLIPENDWSFVSHGLILHGRQICKSRTPKCSDCKISRLCPSSTV